MLDLLAFSLDNQAIESSHTLACVDLASDGNVSSHTLSVPYQYLFITRR